MRSLLPLLLALALTACDSGGDSDRASDLVGTWGYTLLETGAEVTTSSAQTFVALDAVGVSTVTADDGELAFPFAQRVAEPSDGPDVERVEFTTFDPLGQPPENDPSAVLSVEQRGSRYTAQLFLYSPTEPTQRYTNTATRTVLTRSGGSVTLDGLGVTAGTDLVQVAAGTARLDTTAIQPGVPTRIVLESTSQSIGPLGVPRLRYTFESGGAWRSEFDQNASESLVRLGTWDAENGRVRIETESAGGAATVERYDFRVSGPRLTLTQTVSECETPTCLEARAAESGLTDLTAYTSLSLTTFEETDAPFLRPSAPRAEAKTRGALQPSNTGR